jgi:hypothetical protein
MIYSEIKIIFVFEMKSFPTPRLRKQQRLIRYSLSDREKEKREREKEYTVQLFKEVEYY